MVSIKFKEQTLKKIMVENAENETKLRKEIEQLSLKYSESKIGDTANSVNHLTVNFSPTFL